MAVLPGCHGVKVEVIVDDQALHEYDDNSDTPPSPGTVTKYVEATSGSEFATHLMFTRGYPYQVGDVEKLIYLDGKVVESYIVSPKAFFHPAQHFVDGRCAYVGSAVVLQKFRFTELSIVEEGPLLRDEHRPAALQSLGTITVELRYIKNLCLVRGDKFPTSGSNLGPIPEKAMKGQAKTHQASLAEPEAYQQTSFWNYDWVTNAPFATFHFNYRSNDALRALMIIPREPTPLVNETPVPLEDRLEEDLSPTELCQLVKKLKDRDVAAAKIKTEEVSVKRERDNEIVGLGDDDDEVTIVEVRDLKRRRVEDKDVIVLD